MHEELARTLRMYRENHKTLGCKVTHMIGVPLITIGVPTVVFNGWLGASMIASGWVLHVIGHLVFEHNRPVFLSQPLNLWVYVSAWIYTAEAWSRLLSSQGLKDGTT